MIQPVIQYLLQKVLQKIQCLLTATNAKSSPLEENINKKEAIHKRRFLLIDYAKILLKER